MNNNTEVKKYIKQIRALLPAFNKSERIFLSSISLEKITLPLLRYVETSVKWSLIKPSFNSDIAILFFPLIFIPLNNTIYFILFSLSIYILLNITVFSFIDILPTS